MTAAGHGGEHAAEARSEDPARVAGARELGQGLADALAARRPVDRILALQSLAGNQAVVRMLGRSRRHLFRNGDGPVPVERKVGGGYELVLDGRVILRSSRSVDVSRVWTAAGDLAILVTVPQDAEAAAPPDDELRTTLGKAAKRWRLRIVQRTTQGELRTPAWSTVVDLAGASGPPTVTQSLPPLPAASASRPERAPSIPLQRGYPDAQLDDAVSARGSLAVERAAALSDNQMRQLAAEDRLVLVRQIAAARSLSGRDVTTLSRLLSTTPPHELERMAAGLREDDARLLRRFDDAIEGDALDTYYGAVAPLLMSTQLGDEQYAKYESALHLEWSGPPLVRPDRLLDREHPDQAMTVSYKLSWTAGGRIRIQWLKTWLIFSGGPHEAEVAPDDIVAVHFLNDDPDVGAKLGDVRYLPAAALFALVHRQFRREMWTAVQAATLVGGVAGPPVP